MGKWQTCPPKSEVKVWWVAGCEVGRLGGGDSVRNMQIVDPLLSGREVPGHNIQR